jgi:hypothetical protein
MIRRLSAYKNGEKITGLPVNEYLWFGFLPRGGCI